MRQNKDIQNKLRTNLSYVYNYDFSQNDFFKLFKNLSYGQKNQIDIKLIHQFMIRRHFKSFGYINSGKHFQNFIKMQEFIYEYCPLTFN